MSNISAPGCGCGCLPGTGGQYVLSATGEINNLDFGNASIIFFTGTGAGNILIVDGLQAGRPGQLVTIVNATNAGVIWLPHLSLAPIPGNQLWNVVTSMGTPLGANGTATYQYSGLHSRWQLIAHQQGYPIQYEPHWGSVTAPDPVIGDGQLRGVFVLRGTMLLTAINMTMGAGTTYGGGNWWWSTEAPWSGIIDTVGTGMVIADRLGQDQALIVTYSSGPTWNGIVAATQGGLGIGPTQPWAWAATDQVRLTIDYNLA